MQKKVGYLLLVVVLALLALGTVMLFSTSAKNATADNNSMYTYARKQVIWLLIGTAVCVAVSRTDYHLLVRYAHWGVAAAVFLLLLVLIPGIGHRVKGSTRWIQVLGFTFQPSEFAKIVLIFFLSYWVTKYQKHSREFVKGFVLPGLVMAFLAGLVLKQGDLGMTAMMLILFAIVMFASGTRKLYLFPVPFFGLAGILTLACFMPQRQARLMAFMHPEEHKLGGAYQVWQALIALGSGGPTGLGLGNSRQKMYYLPEAHTDFIFPIVGEELGMWIALGVVLMFVLLTLCGGWITLHAPDNTGLLLGIGLTSMLALQAMVNLAVVTSLMPNKGMPMPFVSYGGSNLLVCMAAVGVLLNLHRQADYEIEKRSARQLATGRSLRM